MKKVEACSRQATYRPVVDGEKVRVAFLFQVPSQWPAWETLYCALKQDSRFDVMLFLVQDKVDKSRQQHTARKFLQDRAINYSVFDDRACDEFFPHIALLQTPYEYALRRFHLYARRLTAQGIRIVYIPYGIEIVDTQSARHDHFRRPLIRFAWRIYTASEAFKKEYEKYCENAKAVRGLGVPRFDLLTHKEAFPLFDIIKIRKNKRKLIVWHVHFVKKIDVGGKKKQVTPYVEEYIEFAKCLIEYKENLFFVFLPHPRFADDAVDMASNMKSNQVLDILHDLDNAYVDTADDYRPSFLNADAIITDRSALAVEAAIVGVPVLYMKNPDYEEPVFPPLVSLFDSYEQGERCDDMRRFLDAFIGGRLPKRVGVELPNLDGQCAMRIVKDIWESLNNDTAEEESAERLILFGTGFIYQTMREITVLPPTCEVVALTDNNSAKWGRKVDGVEVIPPSKINELEFDKIVICAENVFADEIERQLLFDLEIPKNKIEHCDYLSIISA